MPFLGDMLVFLEGIPQNLNRFPQKVCKSKKQTLDVWNIYLKLTQMIGLNIPYMEHLRKTVKVKPKSPRNHPKNGAIEGDRMSKSGNFKWGQQTRREVCGKVDSLIPGGSEILLTS